MAASGDRRRRERVVLHWPVRLFPTEKPVVETATENISSEGFFCITKKPFKPGERLLCEIVIPLESFGSPEPPILLRCHVTVKRVEDIHDAFGLGCHIEDYALQLINAL